MNKLTSFKVGDVVINSDWLKEIRRLWIGDINIQA